MTFPSPHHLPPVRVTGVGPWTACAPAAEALSLACECPENWQVGVERNTAQAYTQVIILGPRNAADSFSAGLTLRRLAPKAAGGLYADLSALMAARATQRQANPQYVEHGTGERRLGDVLAFWTDFSVTAPMPPHSVSAQPTTVRTRIFQFTWQGALYELACAADAADFATYAPVLDHLLATLQFLPQQPRGS